MFWLTFHMWSLLLAAYLLGIFTCWLLTRRPSQDPVYTGTRVYEAHKTELVENKNNEVSHDASTQETAPKEDSSTKIPESSTENETRQIETSANNIDSLKDLSDLPNEATENTNANQSDSTNAVATSTPKLFPSAFRGPADDLTQIKGIGPTLQRSLNATGIYYFHQIASWNEAEVAWVDHHIDFPGRIGKERWVAQAKVLANPEAARQSIEEKSSVSEQKNEDIDTRSPNETKPAPTTLDEQTTKTLTQDQELPPQKDAPKELHLQEEPAVARTEGNAEPMTMMERLMAQREAAKEGRD